MSILQRDRYRKKLDNLLSIAPDEDFIQMIWAVDALQSDRVEKARRLLTFPPEAATTAMDAPNAIHRWELETLVQQLLLTSKGPIRHGINRTTNCAVFAAAAAAVNFLRKLENAEAEIYLRRMDVLDEMPRIGHREFPWQRGYFNVPQLYRYAFIFGQGECAAYFERTYGLTFNQFSQIGFGMYVAFTSWPQLRQPYSMEQLGISPETLSRALTMISIPIAKARQLAAERVREANRSLPVAYQPSVLRRYPLLVFGDAGERMRAPLRDLFLLRTTAGVYYDLVGGSDDLRNDASNSFEGYCANYITAMFPRFTVRRSTRYRFRGNDIDAPDLLLRDGDEQEVSVAIECKATKLTFAAQYSDDPMSDARLKYDEIAKGVFQLWKYFSHARRGLIPDAPCKADAIGMILTLDTWLVMSGPLQKRIFSAAEVLAEGDQEIRPRDRRSIVFCHVDDFECAASAMDEDAFLRVLAEATKERFFGWMLPQIRQETEGTEAQRRPYPFDLDEILPWRRETRELARDVGS